jgi:hypothetical protein
LGSEAHACIWALDDQLVVGVNRAGSLAVCDEKAEELTLDDDGQRHAAALGPVASIAHVGVLGERLAARPPWLVAPPHGGALFAVHERSARGDHGLHFVRRLYVGASHNLGVATSTFVSHWGVGPLLPAATKKMARLELRDGTVIAAVGRARRTTIAVGDIIDLAPVVLTLVHVTPPPPRAPGVVVGDRAVHVDEDAIWLLRGEWTIACMRTLEAAEIPTANVDGAATRTASSNGHIVNLGGGDVGVVLPHQDVHRMHLAPRSAVPFADGLTLARGARGVHRLRADE